MNICIYGASSDDISSDYIKAGEGLGLLMAKRGHSMIFGGGGHGMMGAVARGVHYGGGRITGVAPSIFHVDGVLYEGCTEIIETDSMRSRKQKMEELSDAYIMTPGGVGTFDEFFEMLTLKQLGIHKKPIAVVNFGGYYDSLMAMLENTAAQGFMKRASFELFGIFPTSAEALDYIESYVPGDMSAAYYKSIK